MVSNRRGDLFTLNLPKTLVQLRNFYTIRRSLVELRSTYAPIH